MILRCLPGQGGRKAGICAEILDEVHGAVVRKCSLGSLAQMMSFGLISCFFYKVASYRSLFLSLALFVPLCGVATAQTRTVVFFTQSQTAANVASNINSVTIQSGDYLFAYSADGYWSPVQGGTPTGRFFTVTWPTGVQAQAITAGPLLGTGANITIKRADGNKFGLQSFTGKILLNTAGAGGAFEIMPQVNGEDAFPNPLQYDCTGYAGNSFSYTPAQAGYDTYKVHMWGDFALTALTFQDPNPPTQPTNYDIQASGTPAGAGVVSGAGTYGGGNSCTVSASANAGWSFVDWTEGGVSVSPLASFTFTVGANRTLVANFAAIPPPVASGGTFYQLAGQPLTISINDLMAFDYDPNGRAISFVSAAATSSNGLALAVDTNAMQIVVPASAAADSFTYTIQNDGGATATGTATISSISGVAAHAGGLDLASNPGSSVVSFTGVPWYFYTVQRSSDPGNAGAPARSWAVQAWADGTISITDDFTDLGGKPSKAFYRMVYP